MLRLLDKIKKGFYMKKLFPLWILLLLVAFSSNIYARGKVYKLSIRNALHDSRSNAKINRHKKLSFGDRRHRGRLITVTRKTMNMGKTPVEACNRAFNSTIIALEKKSRRAVVDIYSYRFKHKYSSSSRFICERGRMMTAVTLRARLR